MDDREFRASEAKRLVREITPYLDYIRAQSLEEAMRVKAWHPWADRKRRAALERASVCDALKARLSVVIHAGKPQT